MIKFVDLSFKNLNYYNEILQSVGSVLDKGQFILGDEVKKFEQNLKNYLGAKYVLGLNSGTDALFLSLKSLDISAGDEVITVSNSFVATASSIANTGAKPVFVDVKQNYLIDENLIEKAITKNTKVIIPVHLTGKPANMEMIMAIAKKYDLRVIEDCAQAIGAKYNDKMLGTYDIGAFSLHPLKNFNAAGDAGFITVKDQELYNKLTMLRNIGLKDRDHCEILGYNSRLDELQASILNIKLKHLNNLTLERRNKAKLYLELLSKDVLDYVPYDEKNEYSVYHTFVVQNSDRDLLQNYLLKNNVETKIHYPIPIHKQNAFKYLNVTDLNLQNTVDQSKKILSLPIMEHITEEDIKYICEKINKFQKRFL